MTYRSRIILLTFIDTCIVLLAAIVSWLLIGEQLMEFSLLFFVSTIVFIVSHHLFGGFFKLYKKAWEYASIGESIIIVKVALYTTIVGALFQLILLQELFIRFLLLFFILHCSFIGGTRFMLRLYRDTITNRRTKKLRTIIIGAGSAGRMVARQLLTDKKSNLLPVAFIDDDQTKHHLDIFGIRVVGGIEKVTQIAKEANIDHIVIAIPSLQKKKLNAIFQECLKTNVKTQILPLIEDLVTGKVSVSQVRDIELEDLLAREAIQVDTNRMQETIRNKTILVTGAGGSIGSEIVRQIATFQPAKIILLDHGENSIFQIEIELRETFKTSRTQFIPEIADIRDKIKIMSIMRTYQPDVVYHTAAHKHVPLMELHPEEAVKNNVIGTMNVAQAAHSYHVQAFVMVSTDKAVHPTSVMGATKKIAEMIIRKINQRSETRFVTVRFGNVLGSNGSVVPLFKKQIERGGPVTVTHPDMVRYFMTIHEAVQLVIQAGALANGGEIFVLDMGEPVKIVDLAKNLIRLSGYSLDEIDIQFTGMRPGEKLSEELLEDGEKLEKQLYQNIYIGKNTPFSWQDVEMFIDQYETLERERLKEELLHLANKGVLQRKTRALSVPN